MKINHSSHWGAFSGSVEDGRLVAVEPFDKDDHPSEILQSIPSALYDGSRVADDEIVPPSTGLWPRLNFTMAPVL